MRVALLLALVALFIGHGDAFAGKKKKHPKKQSYHFEVGEVNAAEGVDVPQDVLDALKAEAQKQFGAHAQLIDVSAAPDPATNAAGYKKWLKKKKVAGSFAVMVQVTMYREEVEDSPKNDGTKRLAVRLELHLFGDTIPDRKMGFEGVGSSTIKQDVGKKMRPADRDYTVKSALELAVTDAIDESLTKLALPPAKPK